MYLILLGIVLTNLFGQKILFVEASGETVHYHTIYPEYSIKTLSSAFKTKNLLVLVKWLLRL